MTVHPSKSTQDYCAGFAFSPDGCRVALVRKARPRWQAGRLNAIGGKIEPGELDIDAMVREFREETGVSTSATDWQRSVRLEGQGFSVTFFRAFLPNLDDVRSETDEAIEIHPSLPIPDYTLPNLHWLLPLQLDGLRLPITLVEERASQPLRDLVEALAA